MNPYLSPGRALNLLAFELYNTRQRKARAAYRASFCPTCGEAIRDLNSFFVAQHLKACEAKWLADRAVAVR